MKNHLNEVLQEVHLIFSFPQPPKEHETSKRCRPERKRMLRMNSNSAGATLSALAAFAGILISTAASAATYYVATDGSDSRSAASAQNITTPWKTIQKAAGIMVAGDTCLIRTGTYRETVTPTNSGTAGNPITFQAYPGDRVTISGCDVIAGWTLHGGNIYKASMPWTMGRGKDQVFVNGEVVVQARYPHTNTIDKAYHVPVSPLFPTFGNMVAVYGTDLITSASDLNQTTDYWKGAIYNGGHGSMWSQQSGVVAASTNGSLIIGQKTSLWWFNISADDPSPENQQGFLTDHMHCLTYAGAWQRNTDNMLYLWTDNSSNPGASTVESKKRQLAFDLRGKNYICIKDLSIFASSLTMYNANYCTIEKCLLSYVSHFMLWDDSNSGNIDNAYVQNNNCAPQRGEVGIYIGGSNNVIKGSTARYSAGAGVILGGKFATVTDTIIHDCGYAGTYLSGIYIAFDPESVISAERGGHTITHNEIYNVGRSAINWTRNWIQGWQTPYLSSDVSYNRIHDAMLLAYDGGSIYGYSVDLDADGHLTRIHHNLIYNQWADELGVLCYGDGYSYGATADTNVMWQEPHLDRKSGMGFTYANPTISDWTYSNNVTKFDYTGGVDGLVTMDYPGGTVFETGPSHGEDPASTNYLQLQAENYSSMNGAVIVDDVIGYISTGDWVCFANVNLGPGYGQLVTSVAVPNDYAGGQVEARLDSPTGALAGTLTVQGTGGWRNFQEQTILLSGASGIHDVYFCFKGGSGVGNFDWFKFESPRWALHAENYSSMNGVIKGSKGIENCGSGDWVCFKNINLESGYGQLVASVTVPAEYAGGQVEIRRDSTTGPLLGALTVQGTGGWSNYQEQTVSLLGTSGIHDIYFCFKGGATIGNFDWFKFTSPTWALQAENYSGMSGVVRVNDIIGNCDNGDWVCFNDLDLGPGYRQLVTRVGVPSQYAGQRMEVRLDSTTGSLVGTLTVQATGGWRDFQEQTISLSGASGIHDVYFCFKGGSGVGNFDWFKFASPEWALQAENYNTMNGVDKQMDLIGYCDDGDWVCFSGVNLGPGYGQLVTSVGVPSQYAGQRMEVRLDSTTGTLAGTLTVQGTGGWRSFQEQTISLFGASGIHDVYFCFKGGSGVGNFDWFKFTFPSK